MDYENILEVLEISIPSAIVVALVVFRYVGKAWINSLFNKSLSKYDEKLNQKTEALKTELSIYAHEQTVALTRIDAQTANAIHEVHVALRSVIKPALRVLTGSPLKNVDDSAHVRFYRDLCEESHEASSKCADVLVDNSIYFDVEVYEQLGNLSTELGMGVAEVLTPLRQGEAELWEESKVLKETDKQRLLFKKKYNESIKEDIEQITESLRKRLGIIRNEVL